MVLCRPPDGSATTSASPGASSPSSSRSSLLAAGVEFVFADAVTPLLMVLFGLITVYLFASVFHVVRNYGDYGLVSGGFTVCLFCLWYLVTGSESRLLLAFAVLSMLALAVEVDNYWQGTSYLRFEFGGDPDEV